MSLVQECQRAVLFGCCRTSQHYWQHRKRRSHRLPATKSLHRMRLAAFTPSIAVSRGSGGHRQTGSSETMSAQSGRRTRTSLLADATKGIVCVAAGCAALVWRGHAAGVLAGSLVNAATAKVLKKLINAPRPQMTRKTDAGMPSSHAASLFFLSRAAGRVLSPVGAAALLMLSSVACLWRIGCGYHSFAQVMGGATLGTANEAIWNALVMPAVLKLITCYAHTRLETAVVAAVLVSVG